MSVANVLSVMDKSLAVLQAAYGTMRVKAAAGVEQVASEFDYQLSEAVNRVWVGELDARYLMLNMRQLLRRYLREAYIAGLEAGGYDEEDIERADEQTIRDYTRKQIEAVAGFASAVELARYGGGREAIRARLGMWRQAIVALGDAAYMTTDKNRLMRFVVMPGRQPSKESCRTCSRLLGRTMRAGEIAKRGLLVAPGNDNYECGGWRCPHGWVPVTRRLFYSQDVPNPYQPASGPEGA